MMREKPTTRVATTMRSKPMTATAAVKPTPSTRTVTSTTTTTISRSPTTASRATTPRSATTRSPPPSRERPMPRSAPSARHTHTGDKAVTSATSATATRGGQRSPRPPTTNTSEAVVGVPAPATTPGRVGSVKRELPDTLGAEHRGDATVDALGPPPPSARPLRRTVSNISADSAEVRRLRTQLQAMKEQVFFMHKMMQGLSKKQRRVSLTPSQDASNRLSFSDISPVKKTRGSVDVIVMPEENPFQDKWRLPARSNAHPSPPFFDAPAPFARSVDSAMPTEPSVRERELVRKLDALQLQNDSLRAQLQQQKQTFESTEAELKAQIEDASAKLAVIDTENLQLHTHIEEFEEENLRLHAALAEMANEQDISADSNNQGNTTGEANVPDAGDLADELGIDGLGEEPEDIHERCDTKIHELWQTIKTLKAYVESFRVENEDLRVQRDNAITSAERAWEENVKLAGNNNPQQKIKYVESLKQENAELVQKVRELQSKLTKKEYKRGNSKRDKASSASGSEPLDEYPSMESADDHSDDGSYEERTKLLKKMWARNKKLEEEIDRLQKEKQALVMRQSRSPSVDSRQSRQSSTRSTSRSTTQSITPSSNTSSRWKK